MNIYRCTRNEFSDIESYSDRQGYYVTAETVEEALLAMARQFPGDTAGFSCEVWIIG